MAPPRTFVSLGDPVMDVIAHVDSLPASIPQQEEGGCLPIDATGMEQLIRSLPAGSTRRSPGGSASNVARGAAALLSRLLLSAPSSSSSSPASDGSGIKVHFIGMAGDDEAAEEYAAALARKGVAPRLLRATAAGGGGGEDCDNDASPPSLSLPTATCLCLITPGGGQRTMRTCLGAASLLKTEKQLPRGWSDGAAAVHLEGYSLWREGLAAGAMKAAAAAAAAAAASSSPSVITSIDCASFEVVRARRKELEELLAEGNVDVLFCNEEEAAALAEESGGAKEEGGANDDDNNSVVSRALRRALELGARVAVASMGPAGARAMAKKKRRRRRDGETGEEEDNSSSSFDFCSYSCPAEAVESVEDTVGAGDAFAAGFLASLLLSSSKSSSEGDRREKEGAEPSSLLERGEVIEAALRLGCAAGAAAVRACGADPGEEAWDAVAAKIEKKREKEKELVLA